MVARSFTRLVGAAIITVICWAGMAGAQEADVAYVPFIVNVDATVKAERGGNVVSIEVTANTADTLKIPLGGSTSIMSRPQTARSNAPVITSNQHGRVSLNLPVQNYMTAEISLYAVNGRRVLRANASASEAAKSISRPSLVSGIYLLTVKGANGQSFTNRFTHRGGNLSINVAFDGENVSPISPITALSRQAAVNTFEDWTITVSADGYVDSVYTLGIVEGENPLQEITLIQQSGTFIDERDNQTYRWVRIGSQVWMAENLNWAGDDGNLGRCYDNDSTNCDFYGYGRLYNWAMVMGLPSSCNTSSCASQVQSPHRGVCPSGWHVPSDAEWTTLVNYVGGASSAGTKLKSANSWDSDIPDTNDFGFSALPGGYGSGNSFHGVYDYGYWWSSTEDDATSARIRGMHFYNSDVGSDWDFKTYLFSARCLEDVRP